MVLLRNELLFKSGDCVYGTLAKHFLGKEQVKGITWRCRSHSFKYSCNSKSCLLRCGFDSFGKSQKSS
jgi:hypothetical protein